LVALTQSCNLVSFLYLIYKYLACFFSGFDRLTWFKMCLRRGYKPCWRTVQRSPNLVGGTCCTQSHFGPPTRDGNRTHKFKFGFCSVRLLLKFGSVWIRLVLQFRFGSVPSVFCLRHFLLKVQNSGLKIPILRTFICKTKISLLLQNYSCVSELCRKL